VEERPSSDGDRTSVHKDISNLSVLPAVPGFEDVAVAIQDPPDVPVVVLWRFQNLEEGDWFFRAVWAP